MHPLSEHQKTEMLEALKATGGNKAAAANLLGLPITTFKSRLIAATRHESVTPSRIVPLVPDGQKLRGLSTLYKENPVTGEITAQLQWVKTKEDLDRTLEIIQESAAAIMKEVKPSKPTKAPDKTKQDLLNLYVLTDYHLGMMAKAAEAGEEWNTDKAAKFILDWFDQAIDSAPDAEEGFLCQLGDFLHYDSLDAVTPTSRHIMDTDTRYSSLVATAVYVLKAIVEKLLKKHKKLHILMAEGNHDIASSVWLRILFTEFYKNEKRVTVDNSDSPYYSYKFGNTGLFFHHGHKQKLESASKTFASIFKKIYGDCEYVYGHMGDKHHMAKKEDGLMIIEQHPQLAPKDAWAARSGYNSKRGASVIVYSRQFGEVSRTTIRPEMVR